MAEKIVKYWEDKIKFKELILEKLKMKNMALKNQCQARQVITV
jgi:hypothetical protein